VTEGTRAPAADWPPAILMVAPNGARKLKQDHAAIPLTPAELAADARACIEAGASMMHLHVRDADGRHTLDPVLYKQAVGAVKAEVGGRIIVQITTEAVGLFKPEDQIATVKSVVPESASVAIRELCPDDSHRDRARDFFHWMDENGVLAQYILYDAEDVERFHRLREDDVIPTTRPPFLLFVLGRYARDQQSLPMDLLPFVAANDRCGGAALPWSMCAFGRRETACALTAICLGGHSRVGFENNTKLPDGREAGSNADLVASVREAAAAVGRPVADANGARRILGLE